MTRLILEIGNLDGLLILIFAIMFCPPILFTITGFALKKRNKKAAKIFFILAAIYLIISLGVCGFLVAAN